MGEHAVEADRDAEADEYIGDGEDARSRPVTAPPHSSHCATLTEDIPEIGTRRLDDGRSGTSRRAQHMLGRPVAIQRATPYEQLLTHVESRLGLVPRYRQRLAEVPLAQARPRWVDDERFDLRFHVRHTALPEPGTEYELQVLAGRVFSQQLRRDRPLWEMWLVSGLEGGRFAILSKTHHALVDGVSGLDILSVLFAPDSDEHGRRGTRSRRRRPPRSSPRR